MPWIKFESIKSKYDERISLTKSYNIGLPYGFCNKHEIGEGMFVELFYDEETKGIALHLLRERSSSSYAVNYSLESKSATITCRSFFNANHIDPKKYHGKYEPTIENHPQFGELQVIHLMEKPSS